MGDRELAHRLHEHFDFYAESKPASGLHYDDLPFICCVFAPIGLSPGLTGKVGRSSFKSLLFCSRSDRFPLAVGVSEDRQKQAQRRPPPRTQLAARVWRIVVQPKNSCRPPAAEEPLRMGL